mgnify:CR=1 FL=1
MRLPSSASVADPVKVIAAPVANEAFAVGDEHLGVGVAQRVLHLVGLPEQVDDLADALVAKYAGTVDRLVFYNPAFDTPERFERYGAIARAISDRTAS